MFNPNVWVQSSRKIALLTHPQSGPSAKHRPAAPIPTDLAGRDLRPWLDDSSYIGSLLYKLVYNKLIGCISFWMGLSVYPPYNL